MKLTSELDPIVERVKYRGTIIVDASPLILMSEKAPKACLHEPQDRSSYEYLNILKFLAENGYHILIPEIVAVEAGNIVADGTNLNSYFPESSPTSLKSTQSFLRNVAKDVYPNIEILRDDLDISDTVRQGKKVGGGASQASLALEWLREQLQLEGGKYAKIRIKDFHGRLPPQGAGDAVILRTVKKIGQEAFVLTQDRDLIDTLTSEKNNNNALNMGGLLKGLQHQGLLKNIGLVNNADQIFDSMLPEDYFKAYDDLGKPVSGQIGIDSNGVNGRKNTHHFKHTLDGLAEELANNAPPQESAAYNPDRTHPRMQDTRFHVRFGPTRESKAADATQGRQ